MKLLVIVFSLNFIAFILVVLLPALYIYARTFSHQVLPGSKKSSLGLQNHTSVLLNELKQTDIRAT